MAKTRKVTFTLPSDLVEELETYASSHAGPGRKSSLVADALREKITRDRYLDRVNETWGAIDPDVLAQAKASLAGSTSTTDAA